MSIKYNVLSIKLLAIFSVVILYTFYSILFAPSAFAQQATFALSPATGTFNKGCQFTVDIRINTGGAQTDGADAVLSFDPARLSITSSNIAPGTFYPDSPGNGVNDALSKISVSGLSPISSAVSGSGILGTLTFTVLPDAAEGPTPVKFDFNPNDKTLTNDSGIIERGTGADLLTSVVDGNYIVGSGTGCAAGGATKTSSGQVSTPSGGLSDDMQKKTLNDFTGGKSSGTPELTYTIAIVGSTLVVLGLLGFALF